MAIRFSSGRFGLDETKTDRLTKLKTKFLKVHLRDGFFMLGEWPLLAVRRRLGSLNHGSLSGSFRPKANIRSYAVLYVAH
jgi:hypothetical protein